MFPRLRAALERHRDGSFCIACGAVLDGFEDKCNGCGIAIFRGAEDPALHRMGISQRSVEASEIVKELRAEAMAAEGGASRSIGQAQADREAEMAVIQEQCPVCKHVGLSFRTAQLRSADEGQTIFYTCLKCRHKFSLNS